MTEADSVDGLTLLACGGFVQLVLRCPFFPHRKQTGDGLPFPASFPDEVEPNGPAGLYFGAAIGLG